MSDHIDPLEVLAEIERKNARRQVVFNVIATGVVGAAIGALTGTVIEAHRRINVIVKILESRQ